MQSLNTRRTTTTPARTSGSASRSGYLSDRNFLEQYYKRLFDTGLDQEDLFYG